MRPRLPRTWLAALALSAASCPSIAAAARIDRASLVRGRVSAGERVEVAITLDRAYRDPFDPDVVRVDAEITEPDGTKRALPGFFTRDVERSVEGGRERLVAKGDGRFALRVATRLPGAYRIRVRAADAAGTSDEVTLVADAEPARAPARGMVRRDTRDPRAFAWDDGTPYVPFGANAAWSVDPLAGRDLERYLDEISEGGGDWTRLWLTGYGDGFTIEAARSHPSHRYAGAGVYALDVAARLDAIFEHAEARGVAITWTLFPHAELDTALRSGVRDHPWLTRNGGPARSTRELLASPAVAKLARRRLRYLVARYAAFGSLFAWETASEMDLVRAPWPTIVAFFEARARELRELDPYAHLVTTSVARRSAPGVPSPLASDAYDFADVHVYGEEYLDAIESELRALAPLGKPVVLGELGLDTEGAVDARDVAGRHLAVASFAAFASGYSSGAMSWWWDRYLRPRKLFGTQRAPSRAARVFAGARLDEPLDPATRVASSEGASYRLFGRRGGSNALVVALAPGDRGLEAPSPVAHASLAIPWPTAAIGVDVVDVETGDLVLSRAADRSSDGVARVALPDDLGSLVLVLRDATPAPSVDAARPAEARSDGAAEPPATTGRCSLASPPPRARAAPFALVAAALAAPIVRARCGRRTRRRPRTS